MAFDLELSETAKAELRALRAFDKRRVVAEIEKQLVDAPEAATRNRKHLGVVETDFEYEPPLWELRVGEFRVFYDANAERQTVYVRAVRRKGPEQTTEDVTNA